MLWLVVVEWLSRLVFAILIGLSFWSISIIIDRRQFFKKNILPFEDYKNKIKNRESLAKDDSLVSRLFAEIVKAPSNDKIEKTFDVFILEEKKKLEKGLPVLGTLGSTTPFIGLLGTILGIIVSFGELSTGGAGTNSVMFSLAEALILTAMGLVVAIPAVVAFNVFSRKTKQLINEISILKDLYIAYKD